MGVPTDVWRQRIGMFSLSSRTAKKSSQSEAVFSTPSYSFGIGSFIFLTILVTVAFGTATLHFQPTNSDELSICGDVEANPGPGVVDLHDDILTKLVAGDFNFDPLPFTLKNKHVYQLIMLRKKCKATWRDFTKWLKVLMPSFPSDDPPEVWSKRITTCCTKLSTKRQRINKDGAEHTQFWEEEDFHLPSIQGPVPRPPEKPSCFDIREVRIENERLSKESDELKQENALLSSRPSTHEHTLQGRREDYHRHEAGKLRVEKRNIATERDQLTTKRQKAASKLIKEKRQSASQAVAASKTAAEYNAVIETLQQGIIDLEEKCELKNERIKELLEYNAELKSRLEEPEMVYLKEKKDKCRTYSYTAAVRKCVYKLLSHHISFESVGKVIETVLTMVGKTPDHVPSSTTINNMNKERLLVATYQLKELTQEKNMTIGTDETPKAGDIYMTYTITAESGDSYVLGLREMVSKSAANTLETFKTILDDITEICNELKPENEKEETGLKILCEIRNTMSDRAATESLFNTMLQTYREECLPLYQEGWNTFNDSAKSKLIEMNNFYCGLHLLVSMAELISISFKEFEDIHLNGETVGALSVPGVRVFSTTESGTVRTVRTACKALAKGADEKNGCYRHWKTYLQQKNIAKTYLQNFHGNRFNIIFLLGGCAYHMHHHITTFFQVNGTSNSLLKAVEADIAVPVHLAGLKVLGLLNKFITAPLWRLTEKPGHILDMCEHYCKMSQFLKVCIESDEKLEAFARGNISCFDEMYMTKDEVYESLVRESDIDIIVHPMLKHTFIALHQLVTRVTKEFQPGGTYHSLQDNIQYRKQTKSTPTHNKLPEMIFGYLDFLIKKRPNVSAVTNEAQIMFVFNKTDKYIDSLSTEEFHAILKQFAGPGRKALLKKYKEREDIRQKELIKRQIEKQKKLETQRENAFKRREELTTTIIDAGLWQSEETVDIKMNDCDSDAEKCRAIKKQIQFRRKMLHQYLADDKKFAFTRKEGARYKDKPWEELRDHLLKFISAAKSVGEGKAVQKTIEDEIIAIPLLVGKTVLHYFIDDENKRNAYRGHVISQVPGFPDWFNVKYIDDPIVYSYRLVVDYKEGNLEIVPT